MYTTKFILIQCLNNYPEKLSVSILNSKALFKNGLKDQLFFKTNTQVNKKEIEVVKVVTDIDDTIWSSGGVKLLGIPLGGIDNLYKRGQIYPGVLQFGFELSKFMSKKTKPTNITVLTARAIEFKFALEIKSNGKLNTAYRSIGNLNGYEDWGIGEVYYGSVAEWILQWRKGIRKFKNFEIMLNNDINQGYGNNKYIIIGDTGERDEDAAVRIINKYPFKIKAIFLHTVYNIRKGVNKNPVPIDKDVNGIPIYYFRTYVGAAIKAYEAKIINKEALKRITNQAIEELQISEINTMKKLQNNKFIPKFIIDKNRAVYSMKWLELIDDMKKCNILYNLIPSENVHQHKIV